MLSFAAPVPSRRINVANLKRSDACPWWEVGLLYTCLVGSVLSQYTVAYLTFKQLDEAWLRMIDIRQRRMAEEDGPASRTILIQASPLIKHSIDLTKFWSDIYPNRVHKIRVVRNALELPKKVNQTFKLAASMETLEGKIERLKPKPQSLEEQAMSDRQRAVRDKKLSDAETQLDAMTIAHDDRREEAESALEDVDVPENDSGRSYFVLFKTRSAAATALQVDSLKDPPNVLLPIGRARTPSRYQYLQDRYCLH